MPVGGRMGKRKARALLFPGRAVPSTGVCAGHPLRDAYPGGHSARRGPDWRGELRDRPWHSHVSPLGWFSLIAHLQHMTEPFSSCCLAGLDDVDGLGELPGAVAAAELAQDAPGPELGVGALAGGSRAFTRARLAAFCEGRLAPVLYVVITCSPEPWQALSTWVTRPAGPVSPGPPWSAGCCPRAGRVLRPGGIASGPAAASPRRCR